MDIIALSETSENDDHSFLQNVKMEGYHDPYSTPTLSSKGGVAIYVNRDFKTQSLMVGGGAHSLHYLWLVS